VIFFGWGKKAKRLANGGIDKCPNCGNVSPFGLYKISSSVSLYFVPVAKFATKHYLVCSTCEAGFELDEEKRIAVLRASADLPTSDDMIAIWNAIDAIALDMLEGSAPAQTVVDAAQSLKTKYEAADVDYVLGVYCDADLDDE